VVCHSARRRKEGGEEKTAEKEIEDEEEEVSVCVQYCEKEGREGGFVIVCEVFHKCG